MFDFRLKVFYTVAQKQSFTKAAEILFITQPAITKHIHEIEQKLQVRLFQRNGNSISLTTAGNILFSYAQKILKLHEQMELEIAHLNDMASGSFKVGASTTLAHYVLPAILAKFNTRYPKIQLSFSHGNSDTIENMVLQEKIDMAIVEGISQHPGIAYEPFLNDEIVLVCKSGLSSKNEIKIEQLLQLPLVLREEGSGTLEVIAKALAKQKVLIKDLNVRIYLDSTESIKQYLAHSNCYAFLSLHSVYNELKDNTLQLIEIKGISIMRTFQFIHLHGNTLDTISLFKKFCQQSHNQ